jgi:hypothetical protein
VFEPSSRYFNLETATLAVKEPDGTVRSVTYKRRRFIPSNAGQTELLEHRVAQGERLDHLSYRYLGDPLQFWRVCDANLVLRPEELEEIGRTVRIAMPGF